jgi:hypothetical protein
MLSYARTCRQKPFKQSLAAQELASFAADGDVVVQLKACARLAPIIGEVQNSCIFLDVTGRRHLVCGMLKGLISIACSAQPS